MAVIHVTPALNAIINGQAVVGAPLHPAQTVSGFVKSLPGTETIATPDVTNFLLKASGGLLNGRYVSGYWTNGD